MTIWYLNEEKNVAYRDLKKISDAVYKALHERIAKFRAQSHYDTMTDTAIEILWNELPFKPKNVPDKRKFIKYYSAYLRDFGTLKGIMTTKDYFDLEYFEVVNLRKDAATADYPHCCLRIRMSDDAESWAKIPAVREYLRIVAPARCKFHTQICPPRNRGYGKRYGRTYGLAPEYVAANPRETPDSYEIIGYGHDYGKKYGNRVF